MGEVYRARDVRLERDVGSISSCPIMARLDPELHPLLDHAPHAPRRMDATLVWPLEAPMIDRGRFRLFREVKSESGLPEGTDLR